MHYTRHPRVQDKNKWFLTLWDLQLTFRDILVELVAYRVVYTQDLSIHLSRSSLGPRTHQNGQCLLGPLEGVSGFLDRPLFP